MPPPDVDFRRKAGQMNKLVKQIGFGLIGAALGTAAIVVAQSASSGSSTDVFVPYIESTLPKLATWDINQYKAEMSLEGLQAATDDRWNKYLAKYSKLGKLKMIGKPELKSNLAKGSTTHAVYVVPLEFEAGPAQVQLMLQYRNNKVAIDGIIYSYSLSTPARANPERRSVSPAQPTTAQLLSDTDGVLA
jgi:hypothetical protein